MDDQKRLRIREWAESDRPREKLLANGASSLSNAELIAIIIGSGNKSETAVELSQRILNKAGNSLNEMGKWSVKEFTHFKGIGSAKAITIAAALELGRRRQQTGDDIKPKITTSREVYEIFQPLLCDLLYEEFWILLLNRSNRVIERIRVSQGGIAGTVTDIRIILKHAVLNSASSIIVCHNHPSGNLQPSKSDRKITEKLVSAADLMEMKVLDHIIITDHTYLSFADEGMI